MNKDNVNLIPGSMITAPAVDIDDINLNGIQGVDSIIDMIKDTIDSGDTEGAKDWLTQLQEHFGQVNNS